MISDATWKSIKNFKPAEFAAAGYPDSWRLMDEKLIIGLDILGDNTKHEIVIHPNGGFAKTGHTDGSYHYKGLAVDFHFGRARSPNGRLGEPSLPEEFGFREQLRQILRLGFFTGVGFYPEWKPVPGFHLDVRPRELFQIWKRVKGEYIYLL